MVVHTEANLITLTWSASLTNFTVQSATNLSKADAWATVTNAPQLTNAQYKIIDTNSGEKKFYRLKR